MVRVSLLNLMLRRDGHTMTEFVQTGAWKQLCLEQSLLAGSSCLLAESNYTPARALEELCWPWSRR